MTEQLRTTGNFVVRFESKDEVALVAALAGGERQAFNELYRRHVQAVFAYAVSKCGKTTDAEDVVQDTFVLLWKRRARIRIVEGSVLPWLLVTAKYCSLNLLRARVRRERNHGVVIAAEVGNRELSVADTVDRLETSLELATAIDRLEFDDQTLIYLCLIEELTYEQAARALGVSKGAVRNRLSRVRHLLREELSTLRGSVI